jgi:type VI secretion system VasD/TssJ family lipoprotein
MMRRLVTFVALAACLAGAGCFFKRKILPADLCLHGSPRLQWYEDRPHTLYVRVFPLMAADAFASTDVNELLQDPPPLIMGSAGTPQSRVLYPDRMETLRFEPVNDQVYPQVGIVAGYYDQQGQAKFVVNTKDLKKGFFRRRCYTVEFGPSGIEGRQETK